MKSEKPISIGKAIALVPLRGIQNSKFKIQNFFGAWFPPIIRLVDYFCRTALACLFLGIFLTSNQDALAGALADRLAQFPNWESKPPVQVASGDLVYPEWMAGSWEVTSTLVDMVAPLAPDFVTPGFESNRRYLNQPTKFQVRFGANRKVNNSEFLDMMLLPLPIASNKGLAKKEAKEKAKKEVVADRAFNGLKIAKAYLGDRAVLSVKVDPHNPNRQITLLRGNRQLVSVTSDRSSEIPASYRFIATEISQQVFRGESQIYFNEVETTTAYLFLEQGTEREDMPITKKIEADQATAIYLSPQDADYFVAPGRPVALYRYRLELSPAQ